jgi:LmbE family N-acetylglucosaminyl deacetylase
MTDVLCIVAHPDDETRLCGGVTALLTSRGAQVRLLCLTRGEGGELGEPPLAARANLGQVRELELHCAARALGINSVTFMNYVDPPVDADDEVSAPAHHPDKLTEQLAAQIRLHRPAAVLTHGSNGEYGHPAHRLLYRLTRRAVQALESNPPLLYSFSAHFPRHGYPRLANRDDPAHLIVNVERVIAAAQCHRTQHALFVRRQTKRAGRRVTVAEIVRATPLEGVRRQLPDTEGAPDDVFAHRLQS